MKGPLEHGSIADDRASTRGASAAACIVIGGGPGGAAAATTLAQAGQDVLLLERERFPRFHIGESLLPGANSAFDALGIRAELERRDYVVKNGATFETEDGENSARIDFNESPGVALPNTYHVPRDEFDQLLLDAARRAGVRVIEEARAVDFTAKRDRATVTWESPDGKQTASARCLIDATGRAGLVARRMDLRVPDPDLRKAAVHAHFTGVEREQGDASGDIRVVVRGDGGWAWMIPIGHDKTSVGFVFDFEEDFKEREESSAEVLARWIEQTPAVANRMVAAGRIGPARWEGNFAYSSRALAGDGWALVGDAAGFLDPIFSTGVQLALTHGMEVGRDVAAALRRGQPVDARALSRSTRGYLKRFRRYRKLVTGFYRPGFRDVFFQPQRWPAGARAIGSVMAGVDRPSPLTRARVAAFHALVGLNERWSFVPPATSAWEPGSSEDELDARPARQH